MKRIRKGLLLITALILLCAFKSSDRKVTIFIAGDSTAQTYEESKHGLIKGWGQMLHLFFTDDIKIVNHAIGGRSTKTFLSEGRWSKLLADVRAGDYIFIQFGHNDASKRPERYTSHEEYEKNLIQFISDARMHNAHPVLVTSVVMRTFKDGALIDDRLMAYPAIMRIVAKEYSVPIIDINQQTRDFILLKGDEASKPYYRWVKAGEDLAKPEGLQDDTHMMEKGAVHVAQLVANSIRSQNIEGLAKYIKIKL